MANTLQSLYFASVTKWTSGMRVCTGFEPHRIMYLEFTQSVDSATSVCSPRVMGEPGGRSQYQS